MAQLSNDCFAFGGELMSVDEAWSTIAQRVSPLATIETVPVAAADGRVLAEDVVAPVALPPFDNSAVDGFAVRFEDLDRNGETALPVRHRIAAGSSLVEPAVSGQAVRIFTGAPMPPGFDTVFMQEDVQLRAETVILPPGLKPGSNSRPAGEDLPLGARALAAGQRLGPSHMGLLAALGLAEIRVRRPLRVALFSTGDELVPPGEPLRQAKLYDANRFMLAALLRRVGCAVTDLGILADRQSAVGQALASAAGSHDLLLTSGGVSTGEEDHVKAAVEAAGSLTFWRLAIKPGRPVAMGVVQGTPFIGLPGNPVAVFVTFVQVARALIGQLSGETLARPLAVPVRSAFPYKKKAGRREYVRVRLLQAGDGSVEAHKHPREGAGVITSLTETDGLAELSEAVTRVTPGEMIGFLPYARLMA